MAVIEASASAAREGGQPGEKGIKAGALGFISSVVIGVASTAPGYSLAAVLGSVTYKLVHRSRRPVVVVPPGE